jgi:hypothetical protein
VREVRLMFRKPAKLGQDGALALEDYARVSSTFDAAIVMDAAHEVIGVSLRTGEAALPDGIATDIERFFDSLAPDAADRLGWS